MKTGLVVATVLAVIAFTGWASADDESATLEERVKALEERLAALERGSEGSDLRVRSLTVVDDEGNPRVSLGQGRTQEYGLLVQDGQGRERIALNMDSHQQARLRFKARTGATRLALSLLHGDAPYIGLSSPNSSLRIEAPHDGAVGIGMWGGPGGRNEMSHAGFWIWDDGTIAWGGGQRSAGRTGFHLKQSRHGMFDFYVHDHEESLLWEMPQHTPAKPSIERSIQQGLESADKAEQRKGIAALSAVLAGDDPRLALRVMWLLRKARGVEFDREAMARLLHRLLDSPHGRLRVSALMALLTVGGKGANLESALRVAETEDLAVLVRVAHPLLHHARLKVEDGAVEAAFLRLLRHERVEVALGAAQALRQAHTSVAVHEAIIALWREHRGRYRQVVEGLVAVKPRSLPIVNALLEELGLPDAHRLHRDVRSALESPETDEAKAVTVASALKLLSTVKSEETLMFLVKALRRFGTSSDAEELERILKGASLPPNIKRYGQEALPEMRGR